MVHEVICTKSGKIKYASKTEASNSMKAIAKRSGREMLVYLCSECNTYHTATKKEKRIARTVVDKIKNPEIKRTKKQKIKKQKMDKVYSKLHPSITHINCNPNITIGEINLINKMVDIALKMKTK